MKPGNIALAQIQQADGRLKTRPVLILCQTPPFSDPLVCALSSRLHHKCEGFDEIINDSDDDYHDSGHKVPSLWNDRDHSCFRNAWIVGKDFT
jgi:mRNA interferase MazF